MAGCTKALSEMDKIVIASENPVKVRAVKNGIMKVFPETTYRFLTVPVQSGVKDQPTSDNETIYGALQRTENAMKAIIDAAYWVGIEGGIQDEGDTMSAFAWVIARSKDYISKSKTSTFFLPPAVAKLVRHGIELGDADDEVFSQTDSKRKNGAVGLLTGDIITRSSLYEQAVILSLIPFRNQSLYMIK